MNIENILRSTDHRPWPIPANSWSYYQEWNNAIFLHWEVEAERAKKSMCQKNFKLTLYKESLGFLLLHLPWEKIRPKNLPYFNPISNFHEINIRTYVKSQRKKQVFTF